MSTPAMIYLAINILGLGVIMSKNGQPETGNYSILRSLFAFSIACGLLYWGGFFDRVLP